MLKIIQPILTPEDMLRLRGANHPDLAAAGLDMLFPADGDGKALETALARLFVQADKAIRGGATLLVLTDRNMNAGRAPIPSLLATAGIIGHHTAKIFDQIGHFKKCHAMHLFFETAQ